MRWWPALAAVVLVAACSGSDDDPSPATTSAVGSTPASEAPSTSDDQAPADGATTADPPSTVQLDVTVGDVSAEFEGAADDAGDPFGEFVSCSGVRDEFSSYSVAVSTTAGPISSVSVISTAPVMRPGIVDALVRAELSDGAAVDAAGTLTLAPDYRAGSFQAFGTDGRRVAGSFTCGDGDRVPVPLPAADVGAAGVVEVFAQLRVGDAERLIGFATSGRGDASLECPGAADPGAPLLVRAEGDQALGAITSFELTDDRLRFAVGEAVYEFDSVERIGAGSSSAGSFSATSGPVSVTGAFRCT